MKVVGVDHRQGTQSTGTYLLVRDLKGRWGGANKAGENKRGGVVPGVTWIAARGSVQNGDLSEQNSCIKWVGVIFGGCSHDCIVEWVGWGDVARNILKFREVLRQTDPQ
eukprot:756433-Hanusia_phi.AAC.1